MLTSQYLLDHPPGPGATKATKKRAANAVQTYTSRKPQYVSPLPLPFDSTRRLPRNMTDVNAMADDNPDKAGFRLSTTAEIKSWRDMGAYNPDEVLDPEQIKLSKIGGSKFVFTKKYNPDGSFDKYKTRLVFRGERWFDIYNNETYAGTVMSETVRILLSVAATTDMELKCVDVKTVSLFGTIPDD